MGRLGQKVLETTEVGQGMKRRPPSLPLPPQLVGAAALLPGPTLSPGPQTRPWPGPGQRDLGAVAAHDTYGFRIWRADGSPC